MGTEAKALFIALLFAVVLCLWQRATIAELHAELDRVELAFAKERGRFVEASLDAAINAFTVRDIAYADTRDAEREAYQAVSAAGPEDGRAHPDAVVPRALSDALLMQSARVRAACGGDSPTGNPVCGQVAAKAAH